MLKAELTGDATVRLTGRFDASQVGVAEAVLDHIETTCTIDCEALEYISSAGIGVILGTYKRLFEKGDTLKMIHVNAQIRQVFKYAGLDKVFVVEG